MASKGEGVLGERLRERGLNNAQFDVLARVGAQEGVTQQELADSLLVTKGNVAQLLSRMEGRALISRRREGRTNRVFLTDGGRRLFDEVVPAHEALIDELLSVLPKDDLDNLHGLLRTLDRSMG